MKMEAWHGMIWTKRVQLLLAVALGAALLLHGTGWAGNKEAAKPAKDDKCPVCGMFVYKYPDWLAQISYKDGQTEFFDGAKDLFKFYFNPGKYRPGRSKEDIAEIYVMEYYDMTMIDAEKAFFVIGSDVYGPMGHELIPAATEEDARRLLQDHRGKRILRFAEVTPAVIEKLD
jgi:copper chaperone NosL